jgi:hypothetical protein
MCRVGSQDLPLLQPLSLPLFLLLAPDLATQILLQLLLPPPLLNLSCWSPLMLLLLLLLAGYCLALK